LNSQCDGVFRVDIFGLGHSSRSSCSDSDRSGNRS
jgi:hypothetical protein